MTETAFRAGLVGVTGYTGMELTRLLEGHPQMRLVRATSRKEAGKPLAALQTEEETARRHMEIAANAYAAANAAYARLDAGAAPEYAQPDPKRQAALITRDEAALRLRDARNVYEKASYARAQRETQEKRERSHGPVSAALAARIAEYQLQLAAIRLAEQGIAAAVLSFQRSLQKIRKDPEPPSLVRSNQPVHCGAKFR